MKNRAFTLIELLVVVLIIGILAAIAVPRYQKAVMKAQAVEAILNLKTLRNAQQTYYLANGQYTMDLNDLDLDFSRNIYHYACPNTTEWLDCYASRVDGGRPYFELAENTLYCRGSEKECEAFSNKPETYSSTVPYWIIEE